MKSDDVIQILGFWDFAGRPQAAFSIIDSVKGSERFYQLPISMMIDVPPQIEIWNIKILQQKLYSASFP